MRRTTAALSETSAQAVDSAVKQLLRDAEGRALELIRKQRAQLENLIQSLEKNETLGREQVKASLEGRDQKRLVVTKEQR